MSDHETSHPVIMTSHHIFTQFQPVVNPFDVETLPPGFYRLVECPVVYIKDQVALPVEKVR